MTLTDLIKREQEKPAMDEMVRDFTSVVPRAKSEVRRRIQDLLSQSIRTAVREAFEETELAEKDGWTNFGKNDLTEKEEGFNAACSAVKAAQERFMKE